MSILTEGHVILLFCYLMQIRYEFSGFTQIICYIS